jgi:signal transduction histidine kinase
MKEKIKTNFGKKVERGAVKIRQFLETILVEYRRLLPAEEIELEERVALVGDPVLMVNAEQLMIAITNILNNSREMFRTFESSRGKVLKFSAGLNAGFLEMIIEDNGTGISETKRENIFTMFYSTKDESAGVAGLGMGLAIARWVVEDCHKGRIRVESKVGEFARFIIRMPLA